MPEQSHPAGEVFLSYASQDAEAAARICAALRAAGVVVWLDQSELRGGDAWDAQIKKHIQDCALFIPVISAHTNARTEGYFRREWKLATRRLLGMADDLAFLVPVVIDDTREANARVPEEFLHAQWTRLPGGETPPAFAQRVRHLLGGDSGPVHDLPSTDPGAHQPGARRQQSARSGLAGRGRQRLGRRGVAVMALLLVLGGGAAWYRQAANDAPAALPASTTDSASAVPGGAPATAQGAPGASADAQPSVAVLPFVNMSSDSEQEYFSDGLAEELLNLLSRIPELRVAARTSSFAFKGEKIGIPEVAAQLDVAYVLEGSVRKGGDRVRITAQLIRGRDGYHLWSETYDRTLEDIFAVQDEISAAVVESLKLKIFGARPRVRAAQPEAYALYLQGRYFNDRRDPENWSKSVEAYRAALAIDPEYAEAWAGLSITLAQQASWGAIDLADGMGQAREAVLRALAIEETLPEAHTSLGWIRMVYDWDWRGADASYQTAVRLAPNNATALSAAGVLAFTLGRLDEAVTLGLKAIELDPLRQAGHANLGLVLLHAGRLDEAAQRYRHLLELNPQYPGAHMRLGQILLLQGRPEEALEMIRQDSDEWWRDYAVALALHSLGRAEEADQALADFIARHADGPFQTAEIYAWRSEIDQAFEWLEKAYAARDSGLHEVLHDPFLAALEKDLRWTPFLARLGLD